MELYFLLTNTCSKSTMETLGLGGKVFEIMLKDNKDARTTSMIDV